MAPHAPKMIGNKVEIDKLNDSDQPWSVVVIVEEKQNPFGNYTKTQKMIFSDEKGAKVEAIMFGQVVGIMAPRFQACKKYRISNAPIRFIKPEYMTPGLTKQWVISVGTVVEEVNEPITALVTKKQYTPFDSLNEFVGVQDGFVGIEVTTSHRSVVLINPPSDNARKLRNWCRLRAKIHDETGSIQATIFGDIAEKILGFTATEIVETLQRGLRDYYVVNLIEDNGSFVTPLLIPARDSELADELPEEPTTEVISIKQIGNRHENVTVRVYIDFKGIPQMFYYLSCKNCDAGTSHMYNTPFQCTICKVKQYADNPRCRIRLNWRDDTDHLQANAFGVIGEKFLGVTAKEMIEEREKFDMKAIEQKLERQKYMIQLKRCKVLYDGHRDYDIVSCMEDDTPNVEMHLLCTKIAAPIASDKDADTAERSSTNQIDDNSPSDTNEVPVPLKRPYSRSSKVKNHSEGVADDVPLKRATKRNKEALV
ncbi:OLC1v1025238C1 [Oldenlandia corymbosa var. corymbosa]|uniref:OLC1v1025238C1 n=1 Tax=Oldenlandia corymbosa var. corymbosa TaxID=529605 RepID=A0AAV1C494_OLDCO|nr:OLC1v1025238C1 [Oldenlandia corymbosa var. corymbosa]